MKLLFLFKGTIAELREALIPAFERREAKKREFYLTLLTLMARDF